MKITTIPCRLRAVFRYCLLLFMFSYTAACHKSEDIPTPEPIEEARTLFFYMMADNNLDEDIRKNIIDIYHGMQQYEQPATVLIYWDGGDHDTYWPQPTILRLRTKGDGIVNNLINPKATEEEILNSIEITATFAQQVSTDPEIFTSMLQKMKGFTSASHYGLILSSHGSGWLNTITPKGRSIGMDHFQSNTMLIPELREALAASGMHFDFLLFDACLMGCAEVCYELRDAIDYCIASPTDVPAPGFPYEEMVCHLIGDVNDYKKACQIFIDKYNATDDISIRLGTIALINCREMAQLATEVRKYITADPRQTKSIDVTDIQQYAGKSSGFKYLSSDIRQFIQEVNGGIVPESLDQQLRKTVLFKDFVTESRFFPIDGDNYCGLGMFLPYGSNKPKWVNYFYTLDWSAVAGWQEIKDL